MPPFSPAHAQISFGSACSWSIAIASSNSPIRPWPRLPVIPGIARPVAPFSIPTGIPRPNAMQRDLGTAFNWAVNLNRRKSGDCIPWFDIRLLGIFDAPYYERFFPAETERLREKSGRRHRHAGPRGNRRLLFDRAQPKDSRAKRHGGGAVLVIELGYQAGRPAIGACRRRPGQAPWPACCASLAGIRHPGPGRRRVVALLPDVRAKRRRALAEGLATLLDQPLACEGQPPSPQGRGRRNPTRATSKNSSPTPAGRAPGHTGGWSTGQNATGQGSRRRPGRRRGQ